MKALLRMIYASATARTLAAALAALVANSAQAQSAQSVAKLVPAQSEIVFVSKQMGVSVEGRFKKFDAQISFDPKHPEAANISLSIDTASASLGLAETDAELPKSAWFDTSRFPKASFQSSAVKPLGGGKFEVNGKLAIKGVVRDAIVPVLITQSAGASIAAGTFTIKRLDYKIGEGEWTDTSLLANEVLVRFRLALAGLGPL
jgi:polyisoprenoid-binding protein YceI